jgi:catechol 2,3-dioxygenase-like lactoylglutathione lyase family enzyme
MMGFVLTKDAKRSREFFEQTLGFKFVKEDKYALVMQTEENVIRISPVKDFTPQAHTILGWQVTQIERLARDLKGRGVTFERYDYPGLKYDDLGVCTFPEGDKVAWFKDPDGNLLSIAEFG